jgi:putative membrane protein (TIGR04086 family)
MTPGPTSSPGGGSHGLVNWQAVVAGAGLALAVAVPTIVVTTLVGIGADSDRVFIPYLIYLAGQTAGGWWAARRRPDAPLTNGALAALVAYVVLIVVASTIRVVRGDGLNPVSLVVNTFLATCAGIFGGLITTWTSPADPPATGSDRPGRTRRP